MVDRLVLVGNRNHQEAQEVLVEVQVEVPVEVQDGVLAEALEEVAPEEQVAVAVAVAAVAVAVVVALQEIHQGILQETLTKAKSVAMRTMMTTPRMIQTRKLSRILQGEEAPDRSKANPWWQRWHWWQAAQNKKLAVQWTLQGV